MKMLILFWCLLILIAYGGSNNNIFLNADLNIKSVSQSSKLNNNNENINIINKNEVEFTKLYKKAVAAIRTDDFSTCVSNLELAIVLMPNDIDATQLLGTAHMKLGNYELSIYYLEKAVDMDNWRESVIIANYIEGLRLCSKFEKATEVARKALQLHPNSIQIIFNAGILSFDLHNYDDCFQLFKKTLEIDENHVDAWLRGIELLLQAREYELAESWARKAIAIFPEYFYFRYLLGNSFHHRERYDDALIYYKESAKLNPDHYMTNSNLGALYQSLGQAVDAIKYYERLMPFKKDDAGIRNNYGALLGVMNRKDEEIYWLKESLKIDPYMRNPLINLAGSCQDDGYIEEAAVYLQRAITADPNENKLLELRLELLMSPIHSSWENMINERLLTINNVKELIHKYELAPINPKIKLDSSMDRIHFYVVYHGVNDRYMQELISKTYKLYLLNFNNVLPQLKGTHSLSLLQQQLRSNSFLQSRNIPFSLKEYTISNNRVVPPTRKIRVGFFSKFFGIFEPHGLLLDGVMKYLPREYFHVIAFPVARTDGKPLEFTIQEGADEVFELSLSQEHAAEFIAKLNIDIIIFGDTMSEPMTHFMAHTKLAKIQIAFWGNPITSGSDNMDYFVSADVMEHPFRTRMPVIDEPYSEQVVLLGGQGIWYYRPTPQEEYLKKANLMGKIAPYEDMYRSNFKLKDEWFLFFCPQSVFKIHPLFDNVLLNIIRGNPNGHLVVTGGRRAAWTKVYKDRLLKKFENYSSQLHIIERVSSEKFNQLLNLSDVILHPFPFDGSKTSADGLIAGKPVLTLPTEYLRGRMGGAFLRTMNIPELMAKNQSNYIEIAIKLSKDQSFYNSIQSKVISRLDLIWEDLEVPFGWGQFLSKVVGLQPHTWNQFLQQSGRNIEVENKRLAIRQSNRMEFDRVWGKEYWLLQNGVARLETHLDATMKPRIFEDWKTMNGVIINNENKSKKNNSNSEKNFNGEKLIHSINVKSNIKINSDNKNDIIRDDYNMVSGYEEILKEIRDLASVGNCEDAYKVAITIYDVFKNDPLYLIDLGSIQFFRGENDQAYKLCNRAAELAPESLLAHVCMGVTSTYSTNQENSINALKRAMELEFVPQKPELISTIFTVTPETIVLNLLFALKQFDRWEECADFVVNYAKLPLLSKGGALIFTFSFIKWEESREKQIYELEYDLRSKGLLHIPLNTSLYNEIKRMQRDHEQVLNPSFECIMRQITQEYKQALLTTLWNVVGVSDEDIPEDEPINLPSNPTITSVLNDGLIKISEDKIIEKEKGFALITQYYEPISEQIKLDMDDALILNLNNDLISDIFLFTEDILDFSNFINKHKITQIMLGRRCTFKDVFTFANDKLNGRTVMVANSDIYFDHTLKRLVGKNNKITYFGNSVLALLKWHKQTETELKFLLRSDSQDAWIFQPPLNSSIIEHSDFYIGAVRCDNRLAELLVIGGHHVINPAFAIHAIEIQNTPRDGKLYNVKGSAFGEVRNLLISHQSVF